MFDDKIILRGYKDQSTDLWTLPIPRKVCTTPEPTVLPQPVPCLGHAPHPPIVTSDTHLGITLATLRHSVRTWANVVKFAQDHYQCDHYYIPKTRAYCISGLTELFPQHCQLPLLTPSQHIRTLTDELTKKTAQANNTPKGSHFLWLLIAQIDDLLTPPPILYEQRVNKVSRREARKAEQMVIDETPIITIPCITKAELIMKSRNPTSKHVLKTSP